MRSPHAASRLSASFTDPSLVASAGLVSLVCLAERCEPAGACAPTREPEGDHQGEPGGRGEDDRGQDARGADSIDDPDMRPVGGTHRLFGGIYAPSALDNFLRAFTHGHVPRLQAATLRLPGTSSVQLIAASGVWPAL